MTKKSEFLGSGPAIILVGAQLGENIGSVARAMLNFGLKDLRLVSPRAGWQEDRALSASAGADELILNRSEYTSVEAAIADLSFVVATSARPRDMVKPVYTPVLAAEKCRDLFASQPTEKTGILFGPERTGLDNDAISLADALCRVPLNPDFSSLNLAQAVLLFAYEWHKSTDRTASEHLPTPDTRAAQRDELMGMFSHFEAALEASGFLAPPEKKPAMVRNLRNMFHRAQMTEQDVRTFRGIINSLLRWPRGAYDKELKPRVGAISRGERDPLLVVEGQPMGVTDEAANAVIKDDEKDQ
jgi:tRNA/rRNA methyltransferase